MAGRYKLSSSVDGFKKLQPFVLLDKKKDVVLRAIDNTDIGFRVSGFTANEERDIHARACHPISTNLTQNFEQLDGKVVHGSFPAVGNHGEIKQVNQFCVAIVLHGESIDGIESLLVNQRLWQLVKCTIKRLEVM
ncbi:hypothetical protein LshimejAT787_1100690 [Lyophyllum shimeji]|uniref:Uncharacterized protein n=1 Tax=Lyophyllum shimeji TaxID=47721 RepID=A0A9P3UNW5_LYOSH|nr:hypothetical protein LshimejAT787_1100690 [Lyophyllum shimeji]